MSIVYGNNYKDRSNISETPSDKDYLIISSTSKVFITLLI